ncbi:zinc ribbon domain-containing protein [Planctomycetota bacterium]
MGPLLSGLIKLQSIENRLRAAKAKLTRCRRSVVIQENKIRAEQNTLEAKKEEVQLTRVQSDRLELELKTRDQEIAKYRAALNTAKTNKEYATLLTQLNTNKADNSKIETQILELMKNIEVDEAECEDIRARMEEMKQGLEKIRKDAEAAASKFEAEIQEIQNEWDVIAVDISAESLETFKRVAETYDGEAVTEVVEQEGRNASYSCGGCFMGITTESVNQLMTRDEIIRCPNCTRILVLARTRQ